MMFIEKLILRERERDVLYVRLSRSAESLIVFPERAALCLVLSLFSPTMRHLPLLRFILPLLSFSMQTAFQIAHNPPRTHTLVAWFERGQVMMM